MPVHSDLTNLNSCYVRMETRNPLEIRVINLRSDFSLIVGYCFRVSAYINLARCSVPEHISNSLLSNEDTCQVSLIHF